MKIDPYCVSDSIVAYKMYFSAMYRLQDIAGRSSATSNRVNNLNTAGKNGDLQLLYAIISPSRKL